MRSIREGHQSIRRNLRRLSSKKKDGGAGADRRAVPRFKSLSVDDTEFTLTFSIERRATTTAATTTTTNDEATATAQQQQKLTVYYKDDEERFKNRCLIGKEEVGRK